MKKMLVLAIALGVAGGSAAHASPATEALNSQTYNQCMDRVSGDFSAEVDCTEAENDLQDKALNATYKTVMARLPAAQQQSLRVGERAWIRYRDATCAKESKDMGGVDRQLYIATCNLTITEERILHLRKVH